MPDDRENESCPRQVQLPPRKRTPLVSRVVSLSRLLLLASPMLLPRTSATQVPVQAAAALLATADSIDAFARERGAIERLFALRSGTLVEVPDSSSWPEVSDAEILVLFDQERRPLRHVLGKAGPMGRGYVEVVHYFDGLGRTIVGVVHVGHITDLESGCGAIAHQRIRAVFGEDSRELHRDHQVEDERGRIVDATSCGSLPAVSDSLLPTYQAIRAAALAP